MGCDCSQIDALKTEEASRELGVEDAWGHEALLRERANVLGGSVEDPHVRLHDPVEFRQVLECSRVD